MYLKSLWEQQRPGQPSTTMADIYKCDAQHQLCVVGNENENARRGPLQTRERHPPITRGYPYGF
jgi:hypothetical protein